MKSTDEIQFEKQNNDLEFNSRRILLEKNGQQHLFVNWEYRTLWQRQCLIDTVKTLDFARLELLQAVLQRRKTRVAKDVAEVPTKIEPPPIQVPVSESLSRWDDIGSEQLEAGTCALLTVAGGQGTRLGFDAPKGMFPVTPIRKASLFQLFAEKLIAARDRYRTAIPWLIMTSPMNHNQTVSFFTEKRFFGLPKDNVYLFQQGVNPVLTPDGQLLLSPNGGILMSPDGTGGIFIALHYSGLIREMQKENIKHLFYFQIDNPMATVPDAGFLGAHLENKSQISTKVVTRKDAGERVGVAALVEGLPSIVEYSDIDPIVAAELNSTGQLRFRYGSTAIHLIDLDFITTQTDTMPIHLADKKEQILLPESLNGLTIQREVKKFEQFVFDIIPLAKSAIFYAVDRKIEFSPLKNRIGADSIATCVQGQISLARKWLQRCGVIVAMQTPNGHPLTLEITPRYAVDLPTLQQRLPPAVTRIDDDTLLDY